MSHQERIACILYFTYWKGRHDQARARLTPNVEEGVPHPTIGQRWADCDKRSVAKRREVVIVDISHYTTGDKARCQVWENGSDTGREVGIALKRFRPTSTGYQFVGTEQS